MDEYLDAEPNTGPIRARPDPGRLIEIRVYRLKPGSGTEFHRLVSEQSLPLHAAQGMEVVACGQSLHDPDTYLLARAYDDLAHLETSQAELYASPGWRNGPREGIVSLIVSDISVVMPGDAFSTRGFGLPD